MNGTIWGTNRRVNNAECTAFRTAPLTSMATNDGTPTPGTSAVDGMGGATEAQTAEDVQSFVCQVFIHGVPYEVASRFGREAIPVLLEMLRNPQEQAHGPIPPPPTGDEGIYTDAPNPEAGHEKEVIPPPDAPSE